MVRKDKLAEDNAGAFLGVFRKDSDRLEEDLASTMRDLAIASLTTAAAAIAAFLSNESWFYTPLFAIGVMILILDTFMIFNHRIEENLRMRDNLVGKVRTYAWPWIEISNLYTKALENNLHGLPEAESRFDAVDKSFDTKKIKDVDTLDAEFKRDDLWPKVFQILWWWGSGLVIISFLIIYIFN